MPAKLSPLTERIGTDARAVPAMAVAGILLAAGIGLSACGFQPRDSYNQKSGPALSLAQIYVAPIKDREGQILRTNLKKLLNPTGREVPYAYKLDISYDYQERSRGSRFDDSAVRVDVVLKSSFTLTMTGTANRPSKPVLQGISNVTSRANNTKELYSAYVSKQSAYHRAAELAAEDIARQVRLYFKYPDRYPVLHQPAPQPPQPATTVRPQRKDFNGQGSGQ